MMISAWWLILVFAIGIYAGVLLMTVMFVASRPSTEADPVRMADDSRLVAVAAAWLADEPATARETQRKSRKRVSTPRRRSDPPVTQATLEW
jgi:hypothetical protein